MSNAKLLSPVKTLSVKEISSYLGSAFYGNDFFITSVSTIDNLIENSIVFANERIEKSILEKYKQICFVANSEPEFIGTHSFIIVKNVRLAFAKVLNEFFVEKKKPSIGKSTIIHPTAEIANTVIIGENCVIGKNVKIGDYTEIRNNVVISDNVIIGRNCLIRSNVVIGEEGFGFEYDENGAPIRIPHLGGVIIEDNVEIGNFTAIARGTIKDTIIKSNVKIDNLVHIAHNCIIEENSLIIACAEISGSVKIGKNCWIAPGAVIKQKIKIDDNSLVGLGSVVLNDVEKNVIVAGNPAKFLKNRD